VRRPIDARILLTIGKKGSGKSTRTKRALAKQRRAWVAWDLKGEYGEIDGARTWHDVREFNAHLQSGGDIQREVFACPAWQFDAWCRWVFTTGDLLVVVEELGRYCTSGHAPRSLQDLIDRNRHSRSDLVFVASRLQTIPKDVLHQGNDLLIAQTDLPRDLKFLADWKGEHVAQRVANLKPHRFLHVEL
jgi:hypothetical protein